VVSPSPDADISIIKHGKVFNLKSSKYQKELKVQYFKEIRGETVIKFDGIDTIDQAYKLIGYEIFTPGDLDGELIEDDVTGFLVMDMQGVEWGHVVELDDNGLNPVLEIQGADDTYYVPFVEDIVKEIDMEAGIIRIDPPAGLMELNR